MEMRPEVGSSPNVAHSVVPCVIALDSFHSYDSRDLPSTSPCDGHIIIVWNS